MPKNDIDKLNMAKFLQEIKKNPSSFAVFLAACRCEQVLGALIPQAEKEHASENYEYIHAALDLLRNPSEDKWLKLYKTYLEVSEGFGGAGRVVNIFDSQGSSTDNAETWMQKIMKSPLEDEVALPDKKIREKFKSKNFLENFDKMLDKSMLAIFNMVKQFQPLTILYELANHLDKNKDKLSNEMDFVETALDFLQTKSDPFSKDMATRLRSYQKFLEHSSGSTAAIMRSTGAPANVQSVKRLTEEEEENIARKEVEEARRRSGSESDSMKENKEDTFKQPKSMPPLPEPPKTHGP